MNLDLYTEEFRTFKQLKLSPEHNAYYKMVGNMINGIRPKGQENNKSFFWPFRIEYVDQLLDLAGENVYIVNTDLLSNSVHFYEPAELRIVEDVNFSEGQVLTPDLGKPLTNDDIIRIENQWTDYTFIMYTKKAGLQSIEGSPFSDFENGVFNISTFPVVPKRGIGYNALFSRQDIAEEYKEEVTKQLRNQRATLSAISRYF